MLNKNYFGYLYLFLVCILIYVSTLPAQYFYIENIVPFGDPFTYELSFYYLLETIDKSGYFEGFKRIFANWYWLQNSLIFFFSPILKKSTESLIIINFFCYFISSLAIYEYLKNLRVHKFNRLLIPLIIWCLPISYSFDEYTSLNTLGLDTSFIGCLIGLSFASLTYISNPNLIKSNIYFIILFIMSFYGRGNSLFTVGLILFIPFIFFIKDYLTLKIKMNLKLFLSLIFFILLFVFIFYYRVGSAILEYYQIHTYFYSEQKYNIDKMLHYFLNIPGVFFFYPKPSDINLQSEISYLVTLISMAINLTVIILSIFIFKKDSLGLFKASTITGLSIYFITFIVNILMWQHEHINLYNAQLIFSPMRIGIFIIFINFFAVVLNEVKLKYLIIVPLLLSANAYANSESFKNWKTNYGIKPYKIERVADFIYENISETNNGYNILWYGDYNPNIFNFYRLRNNQPDLKLFYPKNYDDIWSQAESDELLIKTELGLTQIFEGSDLIVLPSSSEYFFEGNRYSFYLNKMLFSEIFDKYKKNFKIIGHIKELNYDLYVIKRMTESIENTNIDVEVKNNNFYISTVSNSPITLFK